MKNVLLAVSGLAALAGGLIVQASPRQENPPRVAAPKDSAAAGIGRTLAPLSAKDLRGERTEAPDRQARATVVALTSTTCPLCLRFGPTLAALEKEFAPKGVRFIFVNPSPHEDRAEMKAHLGRLGLKGSYVHDEEQEWVASLGAKTTTEAFVLSAQGRILYRGAVDDQYAIGASLPKPRNRYLADALTAVLAGRSPKVSAVSAPGCIIEPPLQARQAEVTFHNRIQHIVHRSCLSCHRTDGAGPFPLETYGQVRSRAKMIQYVVDQGIMPPWFAKKGVGGPWRNDRSLTDQDKADLKAWFEAGTPRGRDEDAPEPVAFSKGWTIGQPDAVFQLPQPISIPASGVMSYQNVDVPTSFAEDKWLERIEVLPGDRRAVHHVLVFARQPRNGPATAEDIAAEGLEEVNGFFGAYVPGNSGLVYPSGLAKRLPKGSVLRFQLHYTPYGTATTDQTKIGLVFAKKPPTSEVHTASVANFRFAIPPGDPSHEVVGQLRAPMDVKVLSFLPHMHVRGRAARYELQRGGSSTVLLDIPRYDFNWQLNYVLQEPLTVKAGDVLKFTAWYDNSTGNPANPDPSATVRWGLQTYNEMHLGYLDYIVPGEAPGKGSSMLRRTIRQRAVEQIEATFDRLDRDKDGYVSEAEAGLLWARIKSADANRDGRLSLQEARTLAATPGGPVSRA